jgi:hypothetical protein
MRELVIHAMKNPQSPHAFALMKQRLEERDAIS